MLFRRRPKPPLAHAETLVQEAVALVYRYWRNRDYRPGEADLRMFRRVEELHFRSHAIVRRITIRMERRCRGEPEVDGHKWSR